MVDSLSKLVGFDIGQIVDANDKYFSFVEVADKLQLLLDTAREALDNQNYFNELPQSVRNEQQQLLGELVNVLQNIQQHRGDRNWMQQMYDDSCRRITQNYERLYEYFIRGVREYVNSLPVTKRAVEQELAKLKRANKEAAEASDQTKDTLKLAKEATSELSVAVLSQYFEEEVQKGPEGKQNIANIAWWRRWSWVRTFWRRWISSKGYEVSAGRWLLLTILAVVTTSVLAYAELHSVDFSKITVNTVLAKALLLFAPAYAIRFCVRNYNANKHLATVNRQRGVIMKTLLALMSHPGITDQTREQAIIAAANQTFALSESGYITLRDGAGATDSVIDLSSITGVVKKS